MYFSGLNFVNRIKMCFYFMYFYFVDIINDIRGDISKNHKEENK